ncbi:MAG: chemotaxis protein CheW [Bermanella sp.]|jgi:Chemotaxis signal transduction protein
MNAAAIDSEQIEQAAPEGQATRQYLTFLMDEEEYGVDILAVQEIRGWESATLLPNSPSHMKGVLNLRGTIVPILDLRERFNLPVIAYTNATVVVILKIDTAKGSRTMGIIVDAISDVYDVPLDGIRTSGLVDNQNAHFMKGLVTVNKSMVILLELNNLLTIDD